MQNKQLLENLYNMQVTLRKHADGLKDMAETIMNGCDENARKQLSNTMKSLSLVCGYLDTMMDLYKTLCSQQSQSGTSMDDIQKFINMMDTNKNK